MNAQKINTNPNKIKILSFFVVTFLFIQIWTFPNLFRKKYLQMSKELVKHYDTKQLSTLEGILSKENAQDISIDFKHLPLLLYDIQYTEITSSNPTPHPYRSTDTDFVVNIMNNRAILYR